MGGGASKVYCMPEAGGPSMKKILAFVIFGVLIICLLFGVITWMEFEQRTIVHTKLGPIQGVVESRLGHTVFVYYGIPYAKPPVGHRRFRPPEALKHFKKKLRKAIKPQPACPQSPLRKKKPAIAPPVEQSEDCLYMNIFIPNNALITGVSGKTVMVYFHGGAFIAGHINQPVYDGGALAALGDVIVVVPAYRLGIFGFLYFGNDDAPGNQGLMDQQLALQWIKENIAAFGGDPEKVVLFGESAGAISIGYHMLLPDSRPLFKRAIMQSGGPLVPVMMIGPTLAKKFAEKAANLTLCAPSHGDLHDWDDAHILECLRQVPGEKLVKVQKLLIHDKPPTMFGPIVDGRLFPTHPYELIVQQDIFDNDTFNEIEIMSGTNANEGGLFVAGFMPNLVPENGEPNATMDDLISEMEKRGPMIDRQQFKDTIFKGVNSTDNKGAVNRLVQVTGDWAFTCPENLFLEAWQNSERSVYRYRFYPRPKAFGHERGKWMTRAQHGDEIPYVFGIALTARERSMVPFTKEEQEMSLRMINYWTLFAKHGDPQAFKKRKNRRPHHHHHNHNHNQAEFDDHDHLEHPTESEQDSNMDEDDDELEWKPSKRKEPGYLKIDLHHDRFIEGTIPNTTCQLTNFVDFHELVRNSLS